MINRLVIFLIRKKLGLKKYESFKFTNQKKQSDYYYFTEDNLMKFDLMKGFIDSNVSLNYLLSSDCKIKIE